MLLLFNNFSQWLRYAGAACLSMATGPVILIATVATMNDRKAISRDLDLINVFYCALKGRKLRYNITLSFS